MVQITVMMIATTVAVREVSRFLTRMACVPSRFRPCSYLVAVSKVSSLAFLSVGTGRSTMLSLIGSPSASG
jgi:hypothetical protein